MKSIREKWFKIDRSQSAFVAGQVDTTKG